MNRKERRAAQKAGGPARHPMAATLAQAFHAHQAGHRSDAERLYRDVLAVEPRNAAALHLLGALMHQGGRSRRGDLADPSGDRDRAAQRRIITTISAPSSTRPAGCAEAIEQLTKAIALKPQYAEAHFELGNALRTRRPAREAEKSLRRVAGIAARQCRHHEQSRPRCYARWAGPRTRWRSGSARVQLQPDLALAHFNIALAELDRTGLNDAEAQPAARARGRTPDYPEATQSARGCACWRRARPTRRCRLASEALSKRETNETRATFARCLLSAARSIPMPALRERLRRALEEAWLEPYELAPLCASVLKAHPVIGPRSARDTNNGARPCRSRSSIRRFRCGDRRRRTSRCSRPYLEVDAELRHRHRAIPDRAARESARSRRERRSVPDRLLNVCAALARQCFINEYVFSELGKRERRASTQLHCASVLSAIRSGARFRRCSLPRSRCTGRCMPGRCRTAAAARTGRLRSLRCCAQQIAEPVQEAALRADRRRS